MTEPIDEVLARLKERGGSYSGAIQDQERVRRELERLLAAPPPPEPVVRWCLKHSTEGLDLSQLYASERDCWSDKPSHSFWSVVRVEIREKPE